MLTLLRGFAKKQNPKIRVYYGSGWVGGSHSEFFWENHPKIAVKQYWYFGVVYHVYSACIYTLLKVVSYYDLSVLSMSVMGFQKEKSLDGGGWVG